MTQRLPIDLLRPRREQSILSRRHASYDRIYCRNPKPPILAWESADGCAQVSKEAHRCIPARKRQYHNVSCVFLVRWLDPLRRILHLPLLCDIKLGFIGAHSITRGPAASTLSGFIVIAMLLSGMCPGAFRVSCLRMMNVIFHDQIHSLYCHERCSKSDESNFIQGCGYMPKVAANRVPENAGNPSARVVANICDGEE
jgi:hypothetical protein